MAALTIYLILAEWRFGTTLGKAACSLRVVRRDDPGRRGIPLGSAVLRNFMIVLGSLPIIVLLFAPNLMSSEAFATFLDTAYFKVLILAGVVAAAWALWIAIDAGRKRDPVHDRTAGTAVVVKGGMVQTEAEPKPEPPAA